MLSLNTKASIVNAKATICQLLIAVQARYRVYFSLSVTLQLILMAIIRAPQKMSIAHISNRKQLSALLALPSAQLFRHSDISQSMDW